jgi:ABC-type Na+ efflux pump permease subunit
VVAVYLGGTYWVADYYGISDLLPGRVLGWFLIYQVLAVIMYGSLFAAIGAACTDIKETQTLMLPVALLACLPLFFLRPVLEDPTSDLSAALSFIPFATPMLMTARQAMPAGVPTWQALLGVLGVLLTTAGCVYAAGRVFRVGMLLQGKGARFSDLARWIFRG